MRHQLSLVLTTSFLFLSQGVQGSLSTNDDDNGSVAQGAVTAQVSTAVSSSTPAPAPDQPDTRTLIQKTRQDGNITEIAFLAQTIFLEWMSADPVTRHNLLQTCRYYRAFVMPILGETHLIEPSLRKDLLISIIAGQTGDVALFFRDRQLQALRILSIPDLQEAVASGYYSGALSTKTYHGNTYRSIGPNSVEGFVGDKRLDLHWKDLRLVPLNFPGVEGITKLNLFSNQLKTLDLSQLTALRELSLLGNELNALDLSHLTGLERLQLSHNQLKVLDLSQQTALERLELSNNQLKALDLSKNTALWELSLSRNPLEALDLSKNTALTDLYFNNNQLKTLDLSKNTALRAFYLTQNQLEVLDHSQLTALQALYLYITTS